MVKKYVVFLIFLLLIIGVLLLPIYSKDLDNHLVNCEKCVETQKILKTAISKFQYNNKINDLRIRSEEEISNLLKKLKNEGYIKESISVDKECSYRYVKNNSDDYFSCIKHGDIDYASSYQRYKTDKMIEVVVNIFFSIMVIATIGFRIFK